MKIVLIGYGAVGKKVEDKLAEEGYLIEHVVDSKGVYKKGQKIDKKENFFKYIDDETFVFISIPSSNDGEHFLPYYIKSLEKGARIITCEKSVPAFFWEKIFPHIDNIKCTASVGGDSGILDFIKNYQGDIEELLLVLNGTLNYISDKISEGLSRDEIFKEIKRLGYIEPGSQNLNEVMENESGDVLLKTSIVANYSGLYKNIVKPQDIDFQKADYGTDRCAVIMNGKSIFAGFGILENNKMFPAGINNVLYINGKKIAEGPGTGPTITANRMFKDFQSFLS